MLTIFSNPRPFKGEFDYIQRNAISSWLRLTPKCEIILVEDEEKTTVKAAEELGVKLLKEVQCNEFGTPLLNDVFRKVKTEASNEIIAQVNSDIILFQDFLEGIGAIKKILGSSPFFMSGRRRDVSVRGPVSFDKQDWSENFKNTALLKGKLHSFSGMDYWVFPKNLFDPPPFAVGRPGMDSWLIYQAKSTGALVIDATQIITALHQNHGYPKKSFPHFETEKRRNVKLAGGLSNMLTLREADWLLTKDGLKKPPLYRRILSSLSLFYPWRMILAAKRHLSSKMQ